MSSRILLLLIQRMVSLEAALASTSANPIVVTDCSVEGVETWEPQPCRPLQFRQRSSIPATLATSGSDPGNPRFLLPACGGGAEDSTCPLVASNHAADPFEFRDQAILVRAAQAPTEPAHHVFHDLIPCRRFKLDRLESRARQPLGFIERRREIAPRPAQQP